MCSWLCLNIFTLDIWYFFLSMYTLGSAMEAVPENDVGYALFSTRTTLVQRYTLRKASVARSFTTSLSHD